MGHLESPISLTPIIECLWTVGVSQSTRGETRQTCRQTPYKVHILESNSGPSLHQTKVKPFERENVFLLYLIFLYFFSMEYIFGGCELIRFHLMPSSTYVTFLKTAATQRDPHPSLSYPLTAVWQHSALWPLSINSKYKCWVLKVVCKQVSTTKQTETFLLFISLQLCIKKSILKNKPFTNRLTK